MSVPASLASLCDASPCVSRRIDPAAVRTACADLGLPESCQLCEFLQLYSLQIPPRLFGFQLVDVISRDGQVPHRVAAACEALEIDPRYFAISTCEGDQVYAVDVLGGAVVCATWDTSVGAWDYEIVADDFYSFVTGLLSAIAGSSGALSN